MGLREILLVISNILVFVAYFVYIASIFRGHAKPHRTTRLVILLISALATASLFAQGNFTAVWLAGISTVMSLCIFILSLRFGMGGWDTLDIVCLGIAGVGILLWQITANPVYALFFSIAADFTGVVPTIIKTYHQPKTEVWNFFALGGAAALLNLLAVDQWTIEAIAYPFYLVLANILLVLLIIRKKF